MTSSNGNIFRVTGHLCGGIHWSPQRPVTRSFDVFFDLHLNKRLSKQSWGWWFETLWGPLWRHRNVQDIAGSGFEITSTPLTSPNQASYEVSFMNILETNDRFVREFNYLWWVPSGLVYDFTKYQFDSSITSKYKGNKDIDFQTLLVSLSY